MTEERRGQHKLSLARAFRRLAAKLRRGQDSADYQRWERSQEPSAEERLMREMGGGRF